MGLYENTNGVLSPIAGRGKAEYGASTIRTGTISFTAESAQWNRVNVTFDEPMPDADYLVDLIITSDEPSMGNCTPYMIPSKSATGFTFKMYCSAARGITIAYTAYKLYTDNEYNGLLNNQRYSTDEIDTGKTWIDGKKIYRKVLTGTFSNGDEVSIASLNIQTIVNASGHTTFTNGYFSPFPYCTTGSGILADFRITPLNDSPKILFDLNTGWSNNTYIIILEYTKTTN